MRNKLWIFSDGPAMVQLQGPACGHACGDVQSYKCANGAILHHKVCVIFSGLTGITQHPGMSVDSTAQKKAAHAQCHNCAHAPVSQNKLCLQVYAFSVPHQMQLTHSRKLLNEP